MEILERRTEKISCEEISKMITEMRGIGMEQLFKNGKTKGNPYKRN